MGIICCNYSKEPQSDENIDENNLPNQIIILDKEKGYNLKILIEKNKTSKGNYRKYNDIYINNKQIKKPKENKVINQNEIILENTKNIEVENNEKRDNKDKRENEDITLDSKSNDIEPSNNNIRIEPVNLIFKVNNNQNLANIEVSYNNNNNNDNNNKSNHIISPDFSDKNDGKKEKNIYFSLGVSENNGAFMEVSNNENNSNKDNDINNKNDYDINPNEKNGDNDKDNITKINNLTNDNNSIVKSKILENNNIIFDKDSPKVNNAKYNIINEDEKNN